jgi:serine phosphatase RsbU (regulator of sigma subunit)/GAF domain-containing protein/CHASE3 domain sensor protein
MLKDISVKHRLIQGFGCVLLLMLAMTTVTTLQLIRTQREARFIINDLNPQVAAANNLGLSVHKQRSGLHGWITDGGDRYRTELKKAIENESIALRQLKDRQKEPSQQKRLSELESLCAQLHKQENRTIAYINAGKKSEAYSYYRKYVAPLSEDISAKADEIAVHGHNMINTAAVNLKTALIRLAAIAWISFSIALILAIVCAVAVFRSIAVPAKRIAAAARKVSNGDYDKAVALRKMTAGGEYTNVIARKNELSQIALALSDMALSLQKREHNLAAHASIGDVCASTIELQQLADQILAELVRCTNSQAAALYLVNDGLITSYASYGISPDDAEAALSSTNGLVHQAVISQKPTVLDCIPDDVKYIIQPGLGKALPKSIACVPMVVEEQTIGVTVLASLYDYEQDTVALMETVVAQISPAISNALRHMEIQQLVEDLQASNEQLDAQNEELLSQQQELTERNLELEDLMHDLMALQALTAVAISSLDLDELFEHLLQTIASTLDLQFGVALLLDEDRQLLTQRVSYNLDVEQLGPVEIKPDEGFAGKVAAAREVIITDAQTEPLPLNLNIDAAGVRGIIGVPLKTADRLLGVAIMGASEVKELSDRERHLLKVFSQRASTAIDRAQYYRKLEDAEKRARYERERLQAIIDNLPEGVIIARAPDGKLELANKAALSLYGLDHLPNVYLSQHARILNLYRPNGEPIPPDELPLCRSLMDGKTCSGDEILIKRPSGDEIIVLCNTVPISEDGQITSAVCVFQDITEIKERQRILHKVYEHQRNIAEVLQKSFLPGRQPEIRGFEIAEAYVPAQKDAQIGGDFYDLIELGNGTLGIVMGDVSGKGVTAAVHTAMAKYMLRAFVQENPEPADVLKRLNHALYNYIHGEVFITLFYGILYIDEKKLVYSNAGHEHPILLKSDIGECSSLKGTGPALGIIQNVIYDQDEICLTDNDLLVLYTDGVTDARSRTRFLGQDGLEEIISEACPDCALTVSNHILTSVRDFSEGAQRDDIALLVIKPAQE